MADDFAALRGLCACIRSEGVEFIRVGGLELRLQRATSAAPPAAIATAPHPSDHAEGASEDSEDAERSSLEALLYSSGAEAAPFLRAMQRRAG